VRLVQPTDQWLASRGAPLCRFIELLLHLFFERNGCGGLLFVDVSHASPFGSTPRTVCEVHARRATSWHSLWRSVDAGGASTLYQR
jgi:hypothetical protein